MTAAAPAISAALEREELPAWPVPGARFPGAGSSPGVVNSGWLAGWRTLWRRLFFRPLPPRELLSVVARLDLGAKKSLLVVAFGGQRFLVGSGGESISALLEIRGADRPGMAQAGRWRLPGGLPTSRLRAHARAQRGRA